MLLRIYHFIMGKMFFDLLSLTQFDSENLQHSSSEKKQTNLRFSLKISLILVHK